MKIVPYFNDRFAIADDKGVVVDDAGGYGYRSREKADKAMWYKFNGGKGKKNADKILRKALMMKHQGLEMFIEDFFIINFKELARGELTQDDLLVDIKKKFGIDFPKRLLLSD